MASIKNKPAPDSVANEALRKLSLEYRAKHNLTQQQLAELCRISRSSVHKLENCKPTTQITQIKVYRIVSGDLLKL